jgi:integrase
MAASTVRQVHWILKSACDSAVRWKWISVNPAAAARKPTQKAPDPQPPSTEQAARISTAGWQDADWGMLVWLAMMTGARRGELCALSWDRLDFATGLLTIRASIAKADGRWREKDTKAHQQRRVSLDAPTLELLRLYRERRREQAAALGVQVPDDARMFSLDPAGSTWLSPDSVSQRYERMCRRLGWDMNIHQLRHYSATELIAAGVDLRTVAGRLGHSGGGVTTLRIYAAFQPEADSRAATTLGARLPTPPALGAVADAAPVPLPDTPEDASPYQRIAADLLGAITCGALAPGDPIPPEKALAKKYGVAFSTAHRAIALLASDGHVTVRPGRRTVVASPATAKPSS